MHSPGGVREISARSIRSDLESIFGKEAVDDILWTIGVHNFDVSKCAKVPLDQSCKFEAKDTQSTNLIKPGDSFVREYVPADLADKPLLFMLRIADNGDFSVGRLTPLQRKRKIIEIQKKLNEMILGPESEWKKQLQKELQELTHDPDLTPDEKALSEYMVSKLNPREFLFNYSNWIVQSTELTYNKTTNKFLLIVTFRTDVEESLLPDRNREAAFFQITRLKESLESLSVNGQPALELVFVKLINYPGVSPDAEIPITVFPNI
jgi:hypothetical protein